MVIEPNDLISINIVIEWRDAIFDENRFNSISRQLQPQQLIHSSNENEIPLKQIDNNDESCQELRRSKRIKKVKDFGPNFIMFLVEGKGESICNKIPYCYNMEFGPITFEETIKSQYSTF